MTHNQSTSDKQLDEKLDKIFDDDYFDWRQAKQAIESYVAERETKARLDEARFFMGTLSDHDLRELDKQTLNTWRMHNDALAAELSKEIDREDSDE